MSKSPEVGDSLGRYRLVALLGKGGMAAVYRAEDPSLGREVAVKVMHAHLWGEQEHVARFMREARAVAALRHPNIVEVYDFGEGTEGDAPGYIVSELIEGPTLREFIDRWGYPFPEVGVMVASKLAEALACAHEHGIIHRDLKPENVMIAPGGRVVLTDFGVARIAEGDAVTRTGTMLGSPAYMSPEQARGLSIDQRSDLFSLGVVLYLLCTGRLPFLGKDPISTVLRILDGKYERPSRLNAQVSGPLERLIARLLQPKATARPANAQEVKQELLAILADAGLDAVDQGLDQYFDSPGEYNRTLTQRVLGASLTGARREADSGNYPRALSLCDRVLSLDPDNAEALQLMQKLSSRRFRLRPAMVAGMVLVAAAIGTLSYVALREGPSATTGRGTAADGALRDGRRASAPRADGAVGRDGAVVPDGAAADVQRPPDLRAASADGPRRRRPRPVPRPVALPASPDAAPHVASRPPDQGLPPDTALPRPVATHGWLVLAIGPWCEAYVDGVHVGRSPMRDKPYRVRPGTHQVVCRQGGAVPPFRQRVVVEAGQRQLVQGRVQRQVTVTLELKHGDAVRIDGRVYRGPRFQLPASRHRVDVLKGGAVVAGRGGWVNVLANCRLVDEPRLRCR